MAETLLSPGVLARENDQSFVNQIPAPVGAAIIGPTVKGQVNIPTIVTSYSDYLLKFGDTFNSGSDQYSYFTSISAYNYFLNGGTSLLVTRVASGSFTSATSSFISSSLSPSNGPAFTLETISQGINQNSAGPLNSDGTLDSGSANNIRWEIVSPNTSSGTFSLLIRRGDDSTNVKTVLETWTNLSLDPFSTNYISKVIGDYSNTVTLDSTTGNYYIQQSGSFPNMSNYVRVKSVNLKTPNFYTNSGTAKSAYTSSIPLAASGTFGGASGYLAVGTANYYENINNSNTQGLVAGNYTTAINILSNQDDYQYNVITVPGLVYANANHQSTINTLINTVETRGDAIAVIDTNNYGATVLGPTTIANGIDSSYAAAYWPWVQTNDPGTGNTVWVPASTMIPSVYMANDNQSEPWFAPAGVNRGGLTRVIRAERKLSNSDRDTLYQNKVNPIATFPGTGVTVFGQKTLQTRASALDRVNVRRLLISLKYYISQIGKTLVFEQNTIATRNSFLSQVNPYLESVQQRQGLYAFKVVMDDSNNTPDSIDRNQLIGAIYLQPTKTAEFIYLNFNILPTGVEFPV